MCTYELRKSKGKRIIGGQICCEKTVTKFKNSCEHYEGTWKTKSVSNKNY